MPTAMALLERYVEAKDLGCPQLMREIYAPDAVLTYSIATDTITFPRRVEGIEGITQTLVVDFGKQFSRCKTFYVGEWRARDEQTLALVPWLVLMRETAAARSRIGKGYYRWSFDHAGGDRMRVAAMHIHIERMDRVEDADGTLLRSAQSVLPYPWLPRETLRAAFEVLIRTDPALAFLESFTSPLDLSLVDPA